MNKYNIIQVPPCHRLQTVSITAYSVIPFSRNPHKTETCHSTWNINKLTDLYTIQVPRPKVFPNRL